MKSFKYLFGALTVFMTLVSVAFAEPKVGMKNGAAGDDENCSTLADDTEAKPAASVKAEKKVDKDTRKVKAADKAQ